MIMIAVFAKYPAGHHRHKVWPDWHVFANHVFDPSKPGIDDEISKVCQIARRLGAEVRVGRVDPSEDVSVLQTKEARDGHKE